MKKAIINVGNGFWYPKGQKRLFDSLRSVGFDGDLLGLSLSELNGCPPHSKVPYAFKPYSFLEAKRRG